MIEIPNYKTPEKRTAGEEWIRWWLFDKYDDFYSAINGIERAYWQESDLDGDEED